MLYIGTASEYLIVSIGGGCNALSNRKDGARRYYFKVRACMKASEAEWHSYFIYMGGILIGVPPKIQLEIGVIQSDFSVGYDHALGHSIVKINGIIFFYYIAE